MKRKLSIILVIALMTFVFVPTLVLAQDEDVDEQETVVEENEETVSEENYQNLEELLADLETSEELSSTEKVALERKLSSYDESLNIDSMTSIVDKILNEDIDLGQGFVILRNLDESVNNGVEEERALELMNSYRQEENSGQFAFQTSLELRKLSREDLSGEYSEAFVDEVASIIEENGEIETSELKQLSAEYRKEAREENREQRQVNRSKNANSASENAVKKGKGNNASENALNKDNKGKENSSSSNSADKSKGKGSKKSKGNGSSNSSNSNSNQNAKK